MTHEQRLDRLERIARLFVKAGLRARAEMRSQRAEMREQDEKINIILNTQIRSDERFAEHDEKIKMPIDLHVESEGRFVRLAESQADTDRRLNSLIDIVRQGKNGGPMPPREAT